MSSMVPAVFLSTTSGRSPLALGTTLADEKARWGRFPRQAMQEAHRARLKRIANVEARLPAPVVARVPAPPEPAAWSPPELPPDVLQVKELMEAVYKALESVPILRIQRACAEEFDGVTVRDIVSSRRTKNVVLPRMVAIYLCRELTTKSLPEIGRRFGNRDHTTILHSCRKIGVIMKEDPCFAERVNAVRERVAP